MNGIKEDVEDIDDFPVEMTPSADAILDVTPPPTFPDDDDDEEDSSLMEKSSRPHGMYASQDAFSSPSSSGDSSVPPSPVSSFNTLPEGEASVFSVSTSSNAASRQSQSQQHQPPPPPQQQPPPPTLKPPPPQQQQQQQPAVTMKQSSPHPQLTKQSLPPPPRQQPRPVPNSTYRRSNNFSQSEFDKAVLVAGKTGPAASSKFQHFNSDPAPPSQQPETTTATNTNTTSTTTTTNNTPSNTYHHAVFLQQAENDVLSEVMSTVEEEDEIDSTDDQQSPTKSASPSASQVSSAVFRPAIPPPPPPPQQQQQQQQQQPLSKPPQQLPMQQQQQSYHQQQQQAYHLPPPPLPPPPPPSRSTSSSTSHAPPNGTSVPSSSIPSFPQIQQQQLYNLQQQQLQQQQDYNHDNLSSGVLPDVLMTMRQKIESLTLFDSDMMRLANAALTSTPMVHQNIHRHSHHHNHHPQHNQLLPEDDYMFQETRESLKRSSQQSISAAVLVGLAHKRYERRRLAAMEIEKIVRSLVVQAFQEEDEQKKQGILPTSCSSSLDRVRAILLLLSDDYVRSTSEDARKGGVVALAACAIGLKKAPEALIVQYQNILANGGGGNNNGFASFNAAVVLECRDLILASVVHACQDHSQRVRYYATESLFNVVKILPTLAVQHFFILFEILRSLYADADVDVRSGAELLDKKLKEVIVGAINSGSFTAEACVPVFARFVSMRNKATKRLTLTWLQELNEKLIGTPILEFLHLFLAGIFAMVADPNVSIRQSALAFLQSVLPKLLIVNHHTQQQHQQQQVPQPTTSTTTNNNNNHNHDHEDAIDDEDDRMTNKVDFDKILQSLVTSMEHPDPYVRKIAVYWMSRIVKTWFGSPTLMGETAKAVNTTTPTPPTNTISIVNPDGSITTSASKGDLAAASAAVKPATPPPTPPLSAAALSVRNSLPHVLPGILLSIGDTSTEGSSRDSFLPDQSTHALADQTNACLQEAVRRDGKSYIQHLDGFIVALREELDSPGGLSAARNQPAVERRPYRTDVNLDGTGIESPGWFRANADASVRERENDSMMLSRLCALHWIIVLYDSVVPDVLKADYAREFIGPIIHQLVDNPSDIIIFKSFEVLARITVPVSGEKGLLRVTSSSSLSGISSVPWATVGTNGNDEAAQVSFPMNNASIGFALDILEPSRRKHMSRDREVFSALIQLHSSNHRLLVDFSRVVAFMCTLQPPEFVFVSFAVEIDRFVRERTARQAKHAPTTPSGTGATKVPEHENKLSATDFEFVSTFVQQLGHTLLNSEEAKVLRLLLRDCIGSKGHSERDNQRTRLFHILLHSFSHNLVASLSLCLWAGAYRTTSLFVKTIDPLDVNLMFLLELDKLVEMIERPLFRHLHVRMLEPDKNPIAEGSGTMLFRTLKVLLMIIPQSTCYKVLRDRLVSISRLRQTIAIAAIPTHREAPLADETKLYVSRVLEVRSLHCEARWQAIRAESLETAKPSVSRRDDGKEEGSDRRNWLGYASREDEHSSRARFLEEQRRWKSGFSIEEVRNTYHDFESLPRSSVKDLVPNDDQGDGLSRNHKHADDALAKEETWADETEWKDYWAMKSMNE